MINRLFTTLLAQACGFLVGTISGFLLDAQSFFPLVVLFLHTTVAIGIAYFLKTSRPWIILNGLIPISLFASTYLPLSYTGILFVTLFVLLLFLPTFFSGVPFYPTDKRAYKQILNLIPDNQVITFLDLGSGFGSLLKYLARHRPKVNFVGVEISPLAYFLSKLRFIGSKNVRIIFKDFWSLDLSQYDYVYAFLAPGPMPKLWEKVKKEMKKRSVFLTNTFDVDSAPFQTIILETDKDRTQQQSKLSVFKF